MSKVLKSLEELSDEVLAFEMIELTCDEMDSLTKAFHTINRLCSELQGEVDRDFQMPDEQDIH